MTDKPVKREGVETLASFNAAGKPVPAALAQALLRQGIAPSSVSVPDVVHHSKVTWEELCTLNTRDRKTRVSPIIVVTLVDANLDAPPEFPDYRGMVRFEFTTEFGTTQFATHAMSYADTGELTPLWAWLSLQETPFQARLAYIETRNAERHVIRPVPEDIEIV